MPAILESLPWRRFGVEFEIGNEMSIASVAGVIRALSTRSVNASSSWKQSINNNYWEVKFDRTCGKVGEVANKVYFDHGWEIASFIAAGKQDLEHIGDVIQEFAHVTKCVPNCNCGFHIHCDVSDFTPKEMGILLARWIKIEPILCQMVPAHRINNKFCKLLSMKRISKRKQYKPEEVWNRLKPTKYTPHENAQKKVTLNTVNYAAALQTEIDFQQIMKGAIFQAPRKTVEFRLPEGTLNKNAVNGWVHFFVRFVERSKQARMPSNLGGITKIKQFFKYCDMEKTEDLDLLQAKLFLIDRMYMFGDEEVKKQLSKRLF